MRRVAYARVDSPFGELLAAVTDRGLVRLAFPEERFDNVLEDLADELGGSVEEAPAKLAQVRRELDMYFSGRRRSFETAVDLSLVAGFSRRVLEATTRIPYGTVASYGEVAGRAGSPRGARAAGNALNGNPVPIYVPCHRVILADGAIGGYGGHEERKRFLLDLEAHGRR